MKFLSHKHRNFEGTRAEMCKNRTAKPSCEMLIYQS